jgi:aspartyl-tRNA(Asn)/glutamyl-tRNA(Gln) amidotransferase subunit A
MPTDLTLIELRDAIAAGRVTAEAATQAYLDRIDRLDPQLGCYTQVFHERAMRQARDVDAGTRRGPLAGVPLAIKDLLCIDFGRTTCSSKMLEHFEAPYTATAVARLEAAGAVILGKTNMDEFAMGSSTENSALQKTRNPWDTDRVPGGSSGGAAAAMAAGLCAGALGTDTGGSIRQPAAYCGVVGFKPTYGRVSRWGLVAFASSLDQIGPITRTVADAALLTAVMAGHDPLDSTSVDQPTSDLHEAIDAPPADGSGLRIGLGRQYLSDRNEPAVADAVRQAVEIYKSLGATIVEVDLPHTAYGIPVYYLVATAEASSNLARYDGVHYGHRAAAADDLADLYAASRAQGFGPEVKRRIMLGTYALSSGYYDAYYLRALKVRRLIKGDFDAAFEQCDAILCPTTATSAFRFGDKIDDPLAMYLNDVYTVPASLAGLPAISLPAGFAQTDGSRLPVGVQLIAPAFAEGRLLAIARALEQRTDHHRQRPPLAVKVP